MKDMRENHGTFVRVYDDEMYNITNYLISDNRIQSGISYIFRVKA
jgi:hypothetical protein